MKILKVLHLASFTGNIGDNANHCGAKKLFQRNGVPPMEFTKLEIREFFRKERYFDDDFISYANKFDLVMIGGGNYFELWPQNSRSGTTIDISPAELKKIRSPILFYSLGIDPGQGCTEENSVKFRNFLDYCGESANIFVSVRNDGATTHLNNLYGDRYTESVTMIPDGGFFSSYQTYSTFKDEEIPKIGVNLAGDMLDKRTSQIGETQYLDELKIFFTKFSEENPGYKIIFFPHIFRDIQLLGRLFEKLPDYLVRNKIQIAQYGQGDNEAETIFGQYNKCQLCLGNRFHSNVIPIGNSIPTIGLANYIQIPNLYKEIELQDRVINCNRANFSNDLLVLTKISLANLTQLKSRYLKVNNQINLIADGATLKLKKWFELNYL